jgi:hypothetical protein
MQFISTIVGKKKSTSEASKAAASTAKQDSAAEATRPALRKVYSEQVIDEVGQSVQMGSTTIRTIDEPAHAARAGHGHRRSQTAALLEQKEFLIDRPSIQLIKASVCQESQSFMNVQAIDASSAAINAVTNMEQQAETDVTPPPPDELDASPASKVQGMVEVECSDDSNVTLVPERFFRKGNPVGQALLALSGTDQGAHLTLENITTAPLVLNNALPKLAEVISKLFGIGRVASKVEAAANTTPPRLI